MKMTFDDGDEYIDPIKAMLEERKAMRVARENDSISAKNSTAENHTNDTIDVDFEPIDENKPSPGEERDSASIQYLNTILPDNAEKAQGINPVEQSIEQSTITGIDVEVVEENTLSGKDAESKSDNKTDEKPKKRGLFGFGKVADQPKNGKNGSGNNYKAQEELPTPAPTIIPPPTVDSSRSPSTPVTDSENNIENKVESIPPTDISAESAININADSESSFGDFMSQDFTPTAPGTPNSSSFNKSMTGNGHVTENVPGSSTELHEEEMESELAADYTDSAPPPDKKDDEEVPQLQTTSPREEIPSFHLSQPAGQPDQSDNSPNFSLVGGAGNSKPRERHGISGSFQDTSRALARLDDSSDIARQKEQRLAEMGEYDGPQRIPIGQKLIQKGLISEDQLEIALKVQRSSESSAMVGQILVEMGFITESALGEVLTESSGVEQFDPKSNIIDPNLVKQVPKDVAERFKAVPILLEEESVYIAMIDVYNVLAIDRIQRYFPKSFKMVPVHASEEDLVEIINNYYDYDLSLDGILREMETLAENPEGFAKLAGNQEGYVNPTVRFVDALLVDAIQQGASDLHFEPEDHFVRLRYRIDGKLHLVRSFHKDYWPAIAVRIKILSGMNIAESRVPQDGRITLHVLGREIAFRVATHPTIHGENIVMRVLDKKKALLTMDQLGYSEPNIKTLQKALKRPEGIIIVTGPTGSGKTTTLYTILNYINKTDINIMTLEDPVEYNLSLIRQSNIKAGTGMDFAGGVKSIMRQDPDVIFVGEVRDMDTATMALRAAMTGHQVFTSLHTNDALGALPRLMDIGLKARLIAGNVICSIAQRLARKLCKCSRTRAATEEECRILGVDTTNPPEIGKRVGCEKCNNTGYKGRVAISEVILVDEELDNLIAAQAGRSEMLEHLLDNGFIPMADDGIAKVLAGVTDLDELIRTINMTSKL